MNAITCDIIAVCSKLAEEEDLKISATVAMGGILVSPLLVAIGGIITSLGLTRGSRGKSSVVETIDEMTPDQKRGLSDAIYGVLKNINPENVPETLTLALTNQSVKTKVLTELRNFLSKDLQLELVN